MNGGRHILIIGASSAIAQATARHFAASGDSLFLVARQAEKLQVVADDLRLRGAHRVETAVLDVMDDRRHAAIIELVHQRFGNLDVALIAHGSLPQQAVCDTSYEALQDAFVTNALSVMSLLMHLTPRFVQQGHGTLAVISSVAGDRGRQSNYAYGSAKAALSTYLQGLRNRLHPTGVRVLTIKPGLVDTPMTAAFPKGLLWSSPETIARGIVNALASQKDVVYLPWFWYPIMWTIRALPEGLFKRLRL